MAEYLIYDQDHWMDKLNQVEYDVQMKNPHFAERFLSRYQRDDTVEVRLDGFWTGPGRGFDKKAFRVVCVKGVKPDKKYEKALMSGDIILNRRRFSILTGAGQKVTKVSSMNDLTIRDKAK